MSCTIGTGFGLQCKDGIGGIKKIYLVFLINRGAVVTTPLLYVVNISYVRLRSQSIYQLAHLYGISLPYERYQKHQSKTYQLLSLQRNQS